MRIGLLGTGPWAGVTHGPGLAEHPEVELVGVWGRRPEAAAELATTLRTRPYDTPEALFADCEAVAFALPPDVQAPLAVRAAEAGCHLLLEKPVATTVDGARAVAEAVAAHDRASVVFCTFRFAPETSSWVAAQSGTEGWLTGSVQAFAALFGGPEEPESATPWRRERGALWDIGPHALSLLLPPLGDVDLASIRAARGPDDMVHAVLRHASGATSTLTLSLSMPPQAAGFQAELRGAAGVSTLPESSGGTPLRPFQRAVDALIQAANGGQPHPCDARFGLRVTEILAAIESALETSPSGRNA
ncbi:gfo/Idh/MocA family oxidoreductase [Streptomyces sp. 3MP-14]|uniref:Gfo/Idh/MocA family oxidoreductase n=1 Tax=Streptomyces mimosae TaxID=2586635 RepID=A0A5N6AIB4_9ACTN|nr:MULTISPECIES: Gfo/Idh/MocA family oxidoreductase [Streptomyces]KAB8168577.1 gfo/Idh/MocA family oxidoreductase [Streptomyces mimosae]KAB8178142.1 gfo/Idh/MocA family oxidoreductase [Streptomyces sp. 3MP-14]